MVIKPATVHFELNCGEDYKYEMRCEESSGSNKPFIISHKADQYATNENDDFIISFLAKCQIKFDELKNKIK